MSDSQPASANRAVFLSYAREDTEPARRIADALRAFGVEVWFDQSELRGGDQWDQKIRTQIKACALFVPLVSAQTEERTEGYFRREWKLAVDRTHDMAGNRSFIVPVVVDGTKEGTANVPEEFMRYQWTRLVQGVPSPEFVAQVKRLLDAPKKSLALPGATVPAATAPATTPAPATRLPLIFGGVAVLAVASAVYFALRPAAKEPPVAAATAKPAAPAPAAPSPAPPATPAAAEKSVAVLAFADLSAAHDSEYLSDGISEELLNALAKIPGLGVAARTSAFSFKGKNVPIPEIAAKLNVAYVVEGSVQRDGDRVKITAQLIKATDGFHVWSDSFTRGMKDVFVVEEEISGLIAKNLSLKLGVTGAVASAAPTKNPAAYEAYLRGRAAQTAGFSERTITDAMRYYETAVRLDPDYALAWARLAETCARAVGSSFDRSDEAQNKARTAAAAAIRLDANLPEAHLAEARMQLLIDHDLAKARRELDVVERLRPGEVEVAAVRVQIAFSAGQWGDTLASLAARAVEADPQNIDNLLITAQRLNTIGHYAEAYRLCDRAAAAGESGEESIRQKHQIWFLWTGDTTAALRVLETMPAPLRENNMRFYNSRASYRGLLGDIDGAVADYEHAQAITAGQFANRSGPRNITLLALYRAASLEARRGHSARAKQLEAELLTETDKYRRDFPDSGLGSNYGAYILARRHQAPEALAIIDDLERRAANTHDAGTILTTRRFKAGVFALLGRLDEAIAELRAVHDAGYGFGYSLRTTEEYEPLRSDPRFQQLMKEAEARADAQPRPKQ